jgi:uncharacterized protein YgiM (DUF1202 family)
MIKIICLLLLFSNFAALAEAVQLGRITAEVNFREGPGRLTPRIGRIAAGAEVEIVNREQNGWHRVVYRGQRGFVHPNYIAVETGSKTKKRFGVSLIILGAVLVTLYFVPILSRVTLLLIVSFSAILLLDVAFSLGVLYSLFFVSLGLLLVLGFVTQKEKKKATSEKAPDDYRQAA